LPRRSLRSPEPGLCVEVAEQLQLAALRAAAEPPVGKIDPEVLAVERVAFDAWPAAEVRPLGGWRLRFNHGVSNRGSSVWPGPGPSEPALDTHIADVERFYAERGAAACYQLSAAADPPELDAVLAARGYETHSPVSVEVASTSRVTALAALRGFETLCSDELSEEWFDVSGRQGRFRGEAVAVYRVMLERLSGRAGFALVRAGGEAAAVGLGVASPPWAGVFSMLTLPACRGKRLGEAVLGALARWAEGRGAGRLYLQVEADNAPARKLYARAGFGPRYAYHYRRQRERR
jgi:N-acetylglutamate synthase